LSLEPLVLDDADLARVEELAGSEDFGLDALLETLPETERAAVLARVVHERPYDEIAIDLRCSPMVVRQRVSRGLRRLRVLLERRSS
jgi:RNA polymerase sigma factor (sigma-70 family)